MTAPLRIGFAGAGAVARRHMALLGELEEVEVVAVRDEHDEDRLLEGETIDALFVCTPPGAHAEPTVAALRRGVPVYLEKPLARTAEDGERIVSAWKESGTVCAVGYQWRALDFLDEVRAGLEDRGVGLLVSRNVSAAEGGRVEQLRSAAPGRPPWFADQRVSGGILFELGSHDIDLQVALAGPVVSAQAAAGDAALAQAGAPASDVEDVLLLTLRFASGALGTIAVVWTGADVPELFELDVFAESASLRMDLDPRFEVSGHVDGQRVSMTVAAHPLRRSVARFLDAVRAGDPSLPFCSPADARQTLEIALACERSLAEGSKPIDLRRSP
jgi:predicted dehydrogenase